MQNLLCNTTDFTTHVLNIININKKLELISTSDVTTWTKKGKVFCKIYLSEV